MSQSAPKQSRVERVSGIYERNVSPAFAAGYEHGKACGSWVINGNTSAEECLAILKGIEEGPAVMDMQPAPLSGEWSGESIPEIADRYEIRLETDDELDEFEAGFTDGYWHEVERAARYLTQD